MTNLTLSLSGTPVLKIYFKKRWCRTLGWAAALAGTEWSKVLLQGQCESTGWNTQGQPWGSSPHNCIVVNTSFMTKLLQDQFQCRRKNMWMTPVLVRSYNKNKDSMIQLPWEKGRFPGVKSGYKTLFKQKIQPSFSFPFSQALIEVYCIALLKKQNWSCCLV